MTGRPHAPTPARVLLFDAVGTLMSARPPVAEVYHAVARTHEVELPLEEINRRIATAVSSRFSQCVESSESIERDRWRTIVADVFRESPERLDAIFANLWRHFASPAAWRLFDDVEDCLARLQSRNIHVAIASNFDARLRQVVRGMKCSSRSMSTVLPVSATPSRIGSSFAASSNACNFRPRL